MRFSRKIPTFVFGLSIGLLVGVGFFVFKINDLFNKMKDSAKSQITVVEQPVKTENKEELKRIQAVPLVVGHFVEMIDENHGLVTSTGGTNYYVRVLLTIDREKLKASTSIAMHRHSYSVVDILPSESDAAIQMMQVQ